MTGTLIKDLRYSVRGLIKRPGFAAIALITLALGIGANTAIFSVINGVLLRPLNFPEPEKLVAINEIGPQKPEPFQLSYPNLIELQNQSKSFEQIAAYNSGTSILSAQNEPIRIGVTYVSANIFPLLRAQAAQGRILFPEDDKPGANRVAVVSHKFWERYFGGQSPSGQGIVLDDQPFAIVGVMPPTFQFPDDKTELWLPYGPDTQAPVFQRRSVHILIGLGRLKPGVTQAQASTELSGIFSGIQELHPGEDPGHGIKLTPLRERLVGNVEPALLVLLGAVTLVLLIACANVANLLLARAAARRKEMAIRVALGAARWRILQQSLIESVLLALLGGAFGLLLAIWTSEWVVRHLPDQFPRASEIGVSGGVLVFTAAISLLTAVFFGLVPAFEAARTDVGEALKASGKSSSDSSRSRLRRALVVTEVALSLMLFVGAGLLIKSFWRLTNVNPGFDSNNLLTLKVSLPERKYPRRDQVITFYQQLPAKLSALPGVQAVSAVNRLPISGGDPHGQLSIEGRPFAPGEAPGVSFRRILPNYFRAMGIPLLQGREFDERDTGGKPDLVIINQKMAQRYWPNNDAVGKRIRVGPSESEPWMTVVGIVGNVSHEGLDVEPDLATYEPHAKRPWSDMILLVRTSTDPLSAAGPVQAALKNEEKDILIENVTTMTGRIHESVAPQRLTLVLLGSFAGLALLLAVIGIYGVMTYLVTQRTQEIGIRLALGAQPLDVLRLVVGEGMKLVLIGVGLGLFGSFAITRVLTKLLFGVSATDPLTFGAVTFVLAGVALLAAYIPARRATKVDPLVALRYE